MMKKDTDYFATVLFISVRLACVSAVIIKVLDMIFLG